MSERWFNLTIAMHYNIYKCFKFDYEKVKYFCYLSIANFNYSLNFKISALYCQYPNIVFKKGVAVAEWLMSLTVKHWSLTAVGSSPGRGE